MNSIEFKGLKLLIIVVIIYAILAIFDYSHFIIASSKSIKVIITLIPIFAFIIIITALINYYLKPKQILKHFGQDSGKKGIFYSLIGGILSHGPMYAWFGMLGDMKQHGLKNGLIATFFYARAIKLPLLPMMLAIFGLSYTIVINIYIIIFAIIQGKIIDRFYKS
jgi:uncharacterized membrane protein YraQ (UPF0718 family)